MRDDALRRIVGAAVRTVEADVDRLAPFMANRVRAWTRALAHDADPSAYFAHPRAFPFVQLPYWFETAARGQVDEALHERLAASSICGYYFIRVLDGLIDGHATTELSLLPILGTLHERFAAPYHALFPQAHPFHERFAVTWSACLDATARDALEGAPTLEDFVRVTSRKVLAASLPLEAIAHHLGLSDRLAPWMAFFDRFGRWHLMEEDLFDFHEDATRGARTYVLSEADRCRAAGQGPVGWLFDSGGEQIQATMRGWMNEMSAIAATLGTSGPGEYLGMRKADLERRWAAVKPGLAVMARLEAALPGAAR